MDVICIGNLNFDIAFRLPQLPEAHQKVRCNNTTFGCGGSAGNTACWLSALGVATAVVGAVGEDALGRAQLDDLSQHGVDTTYVRKEGQTGVAVIIVEGEQKRMLKFTGANQSKEIPEDIRHVPHVHLSSNEREAVEEVVTLCRSTDTVLSWDPQELFFEEFSRFFHYIFMNEDDLMRKTGVDDMESAAATIESKVLVVTKNGGGCLIFTEGSVLDVPSFHLEAVDTTGAGDAFDAGFIFGLQKKKSLGECGLLGVACASVKVQHCGARGGICDIHGVETFLKAHGVDL